MAYAPEDYGDDGDYADEVLFAAEFIFHWSYGDDGGTLSRLKGDEEQDPDEEDGNDADGEGDEEPDTPTGLRAHVLQGDDVLGGGDGGGGTADVGCEGDA